MGGMERGRTRKDDIWLDNLTLLDFKKKVAEGVCVLIPLGAVEEHGPHLPLGTDYFQPLFVLEETARRTGSIIAPLMPYGNCVSTSPFPGTISISTDTVNGLVNEIVTELYRHGIRRVVIVSGHAGGGHMAAVREGVWKVVKENPDLKAAVLSDYDLAYEFIGKDGVPKDDGHAGTVETSRMMAIRPDLVGKPPKQVEGDTPKRFRIYPGWDIFYRNGVMGGDPSKATAALGKKVNDHVIEGLVNLVKDL